MNQLIIMCAPGKKNKSQYFVPAKQQLIQTLKNVYKIMIQMKFYKGTRENNKWIKKY